jgi:hypothetical protein
VPSSIVKIGPIDTAETSVSSHFTQCNNPEDQRSQRPGGLPVWYFVAYSVGYYLWYVSQSRVELSLAWKVWHSVGLALLCKSLIC